MSLCFVLSHFSFNVQKSEGWHVLPWILSENGAVHICSLVMLARLKFGIGIAVIFDSQHISDDSTGLEILTRHLRNKKKQFLQINFCGSPFETMTTFPGFIIIILVFYSIWQCTYKQLFPFQGCLPHWSTTSHRHQSVHRAVEDGCSTWPTWFHPFAWTSRGFLVKIGEERRLCEKQVGKSSVMQLQMTRVWRTFSSPSIIKCHLSSWLYAENQKTRENHRGL